MTTQLSRAVSAVAPSASSSSTVACTSRCTRCLTVRGSGTVLIQTVCSGSSSSSTKSVAESPAGRDRSPRAADQKAARVAPSVASMTRSLNAASAIAPPYAGRPHVRPSYGRRRRAPPAGDARLRRARAASAAREGLLEERLLLGLVQLRRASGGRRRRRAGHHVDVRDVHRQRHVDVAPGALVLRLVLDPHHLGVAVLGALRADLLLREGVELLEPDDRHALVAALGALREEVVVDTARAQEHAVDL